MSRHRRSAATGLFAICTSLIFGGLWRPIWIDEYLHFSIAGLPWSEIFEIIGQTSSTVNHGQSWMYQILSIVSLKLLGASTFALRLPSILATFALIMTLFGLLRMWKVPLFLQVALFTSLLSIKDFYFHFGNARPYVFLLLATAGTLYLSLKEYRQRGSRGNETAGIWLVSAFGALCHPYYPVVLAMVLLANSYSLCLLDGGEKPSVLDLLRRNFALVLFSAAISVAVGSATWLKGSPSFASMNPFETLPFPMNHEVFILGSLIIALAFIPFLRPKRIRGLFRGEPKLTFGLIYLLAGIGLAAVFSWVSYVRGYWIIPRQWISGALISFFGATLLLSKFGARVLGSLTPRVSVLTHKLSLVASLLALAVSITLEGCRIIEDQSFWTNLDPSVIATCEDVAECYVLAGNLNLSCGGKIWEEHSSYYGNLDVSIRGGEFINLFEQCNSSGKQ